MSNLWLINFTEDQKGTSAIDVLRHGKGLSVGRQIITGNDYEWD
jgi:hypothetical protein